MEHQKPKCEYENCDKESDVELIIESPVSGVKDEHHWYCMEHHLIMKSKPKWVERK